MDYLDEDAQKTTASTGTPPSADAVTGTDLELDLETDAELAPADKPEAIDNDPLLQELLPEDRNARRRVVTALLRAVLAERKIT